MKKMYSLGISILCCLLVACSDDKLSTDTDSADSLDADTTAISEEFYDEGYEDTYNDGESYSDSYDDYDSYEDNSSGVTYGDGKDYDISKYENYERVGNDPQDFADAMILKVIRMIYEENFKNARAKVLGSELNEGRYTIDMQVSWSDKWVRGYEMQGTLEVNEDGSMANFTVTDKNLEAEALEVTKEDYQETLTVDQI